MGLSMYEKTRVEIEGSFFTKGNKDRSFGDAYNVGVSSKNIELMGNVYMDLWNFHYIQPFAGLGAGLAFINTKAADVAKDNTKFSAMGTMGLSMPFGCFNVEVAARYNYIDIDSGMHNFSGDVGIRYMF
jgi:opacity protein-like surface antigen